ncbi:MAG: hypothetical protein K1X66_04740 [Verrucomicrobiae bacterium]|nr:hypothetical protein [Verrucomicrobiae bacterium]
MQKLNYFLMAILASALFSACTSDTLYDIGGAAVGGLAGNILTDGDPIATAAGAGIGVLGSTLVRDQATKARVKSFNDGYNKGRSDAAKQQYWIQQNLQKDLADRENDTRVSYVPFVTPERKMADGTILESQTHYIRVEN